MQNNSYVHKLSYPQHFLGIVPLCGKYFGQLAAMWEVNERTKNSMNCERPELVMAEHKKRQITGNIEGKISPGDSPKEEEMCQNIRQGSPNLHIEQENPGLIVNRLKGPKHEIFGNRVFYAIQACMSR